MANILIVANLNCDRVLQLDKLLEAGGRFHYQDGGQRLGGGGANTGLGLVWADHHVALVSQVGRDEVGDWLLAEASTQGIDCHLIQRHEQITNEILLVMTPDGERTIMRPERPSFELTSPPDWLNWDVVYFNSVAQGVEHWAQSALASTLVVSQLDGGRCSQPSHILIASLSDIRLNNQTPWQYAKAIAGESLKYFIITNGADGATVYTADNQQHVAAVVAQVIDTTGAGDAYAAGIIHGQINGMSIISSMEEAARWAGYAVATPCSIPGLAFRDYINQ